MTCHLRHLPPVPWILREERAQVLRKAINRAFGGELSAHGIHLDVKVTADLSIARKIEADLHHWESYSYPGEGVGGSRQEHAKARQIAAALAAKPRILYLVIKYLMGDEP